MTIRYWESEMDDLMAHNARAGRGFFNSLRMCCSVQGDISFISPYFWLVFVFSCLEQLQSNILGVDQNFIFKAVDYNVLNNY